MRCDRCDAGAIVSVRCYLGCWHEQCERCASYTLAERDAAVMDAWVGNCSLCGTYAPAIARTDVASLQTSLYCSRCAPATASDFQ